MLGAKNTKIALSIVDGDLLNLEREIERMESLQVDCMHLDVMDGNFVEQITFGQPILKLLRKKTNLFMDVHLMIKNTDICLDSFIACGADMITVHVESADNLNLCLKKIKDNKMQSCVALKPATPLCFIEEVLDVTDSVHIMTADPGHEDQGFISSSMDKIKNCRKLLDSYSCIKRPNKFIDIFADGAIDQRNYKALINAGASILVLESVFLKSEDAHTLIKDIKHYSDRLSIL